LVAKASLPFPLEQSTALSLFGPIALSCTLSWIRAERKGRARAKVERFPDRAGMEMRFLVSFCPGEVPSQTGLLWH
jgi:hypothetical protein